MGGGRWDGLALLGLSRDSRLDGSVKRRTLLRVVRGATPKNFRCRRGGKLGGPKSSKCAAHDGETIPELDYDQILFGIRHPMDISSMQQGPMSAEGSRSAVVSRVGYKKPARG